MTFFNSFMRPVDTSLVPSLAMGLLVGGAGLYGSIAYQDEPTSIQGTTIAQLALMETGSSLGPFARSAIGGLCFVSGSLITGLATRRLWRGPEETGLQTPPTRLTLDLELRTPVRGSQTPPLPPEFDFELSEKSFDSSDSSQLSVEDNEDGVRALQAPDLAGELMVLEPEDQAEVVVQEAQTPVENKTRPGKHKGGHDKIFKVVKKPINFKKSKSSPAVIAEMKRQMEGFEQEGRTGSAEYLRIKEALNCINTPEVVNFRTRESRRLSHLPAPAKKT